MTGADDWSTPEVVRAINRLSTALEHFEDGVTETFSGLDQKYVPREVHDAVVLRLETRINGVEQAREASRSWARELIAPTITGLVVGALLLVVSIVVQH